jgi:heme exporter protein B
MNSFLNSSIEIFRKDILSELRTRYAINSLLMFISVTIIIIKLSTGDNLTPGNYEIITGLLWIVIFFSSISGLSRVFIKEEERETSAALKLSADSISVYTGKLIFNFILSFTINIFSITAFVLVTDLQVRNISSFIVIIIAGNAGLVSASTIIAAIIAKTSNKGTLYPVLAFPVLLPILISVINSTNISVSGGGIPAISDDLIIIISYTIVVITASLLLFRFIWED